MLEARNTPVGNYQLPAKLAAGRQPQSYLLIQVIWK